MQWKALEEAKKGHVRAPGNWAVQLDGRTTTPDGGQLRETVGGSVHWVSLPLP